jgi:hypothetical protein
MVTGTTTTPGLRHPLDPRALDAARAMFDSAPFLNPNGPSGIHLVLDVHSIPYAPEICFDNGAASWCDDPVMHGAVRYSVLKSSPNHFDNANRDKVFHYAIWGDAQSWGYSGMSDWADDLIVTFDWKDDAFQTIRSQAEALVHEIGHDLGLHHGPGISDDKHVTAYWSVMSYSWYQRTGQDDAWRAVYVTCPPMYYRKAGVSEPSGALPAIVGTAIDYSSGMGKWLGPSTAAPVVKTCGQAIDWRFNSPGGDAGDWGRITFDGPVREGEVP